MKNARQDETPPQWAVNFLRWYCRPRLAEDLEGDLYEYFQRNVTEKGLRRARWIYAIDVLKFLRHTPSALFSSSHFFPILSCSAVI